MIIIQLDSEQLGQVIQENVRKIIKEAPANTGNKPFETEDELLTVSQAADFLSLKKSTIYTLTCRGELPLMKRSKRNYYSRKDLINYLKEGRRKTNSEIEAEAVKFGFKEKKGLKHEKK